MNRHSPCCRALAALVALSAGAALAPERASAGAQPASASNSAHVVMAWWKQSYDPAHPDPIWQTLYRPRHWNDGDDTSVTNAHWSRWTRTDATAHATVIISGERGIGRIHLFHPGYCAAVHRRAFLRMRVSGGPWGDGATENVGQACAGP